jgi:methionyl-tRNA formyltransferase
MLLCGNKPNQIALANKVALQFNLVGIVVENRNNKKLTLAEIVAAIINKVLFFKIDHAWKNMQNYYLGRYSDFPARTEKVVTENINNDITIKFIEKIKPDLIMVSGTRLIKDELLSIQDKIKIVNLHTGLSPYVKGGPNCTNWCLAYDEPHLIGNTIMWLNSGIDSGNIISSETVEFSGSESFPEIHIKVMEAAHDLYLRCLSSIQLHPDKCPSVKQETIASGRIFKTKEWTFGMRWKLLKNIVSNKFSRTVASEDYKSKRAKLFTVKLPSQ